MTQHKLLADFNRYFTSSNGVDVPERVSVPRDEWRALFAALSSQGAGKAAQPARVVECSYPRCQMETDPTCKGPCWLSTTPAAPTPSQAGAVTELEATLADACATMIEWDAREKDHSIVFSARMELCNLAFEKARAALAAFEAKKAGA